MDTPAATGSLPRRVADSYYGRGVLYTVGAAVAFGLLPTLSGLAKNGGMGSPTFTALRAATGAVILACLVASGRRERVSLPALPVRERVMLAIATVANGSLNLALFAAYGAMAVAVVMPIYFMYPLLVAGASVALGRERFTPARIGGLALAVAGLVVALGSQIGPGAAVSGPGILLAAATAVCQATYLVASRAGYPSVPSDQATSVILGGGAVMAAVAAFAIDGSAGRTAWLLSPQAIGAVLVAGTLGAALAKVWLLRGVRRIGGTRAAVLMLGEPITGVLVAALVLGQALTPAVVGGGLLILAGGALTQRPARARLT